MNGQGEKPTIEEVIDFCTLCLKGARYQARKAEAENWPHDLSSFHGARHAFESVIDFCHGKNDFKVIPVFWGAVGNSGSTISLANLAMLENCLNDGYKIIRESGLAGSKKVTPALIYILEKEDTK